MNLTFTPPAWDDYQWFAQHDRKLLKRINQLIQDTLRTPFDGIGKPEPLKGDLAGCWSRRINDEHRLVYEVPRPDRNDLTSCFGMALGFATQFGFCANKRPI